MALNYANLDDPTQDIRVITLLPAEDINAELRVSLFHTSLGTAVYDALSYAWVYANPSLLSLAAILI